MQLRVVAGRLLALWGLLLSTSMTQSYPDGHVMAVFKNKVYLITDGDTGKQVSRFATSGDDTVLDAIGWAERVGLARPPRRCYLLRRSEDGKRNEVLPIDWEAITGAGDTSTNYLLQPGDRLWLRKARPPK
jgi:hypothetical protein